MNRKYIERLLELVKLFDEEMSKVDWRVNTEPYLSLKSKWDFLKGYISVLQEEKGE